MKEGNHGGVAWLAGEYLWCHGKPVDQVAWNDFQRDTIPNALRNSDDLPGKPTLPTSASIQALYGQSPSQPPSSSIVNTVSESRLSPNIGTFSPRPDHHGIMWRHCPFYLETPCATTFWVKVHRQEGEMSCRATFARSVTKGCCWRGQIKLPEVDAQFAENSFRPGNGMVEWYKSRACHRWRFDCQRPRIVDTAVVISSTVALIARIPES
jgi:hypothetical protein